MADASGRQSAQHSYIPSIDGLRAVAVLAVMLYHLDASWLPGGFSGVDVFFVISGYVVAASLARQEDSRFIPFALRFYARRMLRILPALLFCLVLVTLASVALIPEAWLSDSSDKTGLFAFFGISNIALLLFNDGYFSPRVEFNPFTHTWSLGVEEQFYLIFPLLFFSWLRFRQASGVVGLAASRLITGLLLASLCYAAWESSHRPQWAFYLLPSRFWELAAGAMLFQLHTAGRLLVHGRVQPRLTLWVGVGLLLLSFGWSDDKAFPFPWALVAVAGTLFVITAVAVADGPRPWLQQWLEQPLATGIGRLSYSLYLWHWPIYVLMRWTLGLERWWQVGLALLLSFLMALLSYRFVERPIRCNPWSPAQPSWKTVAAGCALVLLAFTLATQILEARTQLSLSVTSAKQLWYPRPWPSAVDPKTQDLAGRQLFAIGDSHVGAYATMLQRLADERGAIVSWVFAGDCPVASLVWDRASRDPGCWSQLEHSLAEIEARARPGDILFLASLRVLRLADQFEVFPYHLVQEYRVGPEADARRKRALEDAAALIERFQQQGLQVVIDAPKPVFRAPAFRCADWFNRHNPICEQGFKMDRSMLLEHRAEVMKSLARLQTRFPDLHVWDPFPILCPGPICSAFDGEQPLFFDADHLSAHGNQLLYPSFESLVSAIWQGTHKTDSQTLRRDVRMQ